MTDPGATFAPGFFLAPARRHGDGVPMNFEEDEAATAQIDALIAPPVRLALAYAPRRARGAWRAFMALDRRLAQLIDPSREPMLAQMRLAWWRETFARPAGEWPAGEPLLAALRPWGEGRAAFTELVDGWEAMIGDAPLATVDIAATAQGRAAAMAGLSRVLNGGAVAALAYRWALADLAVHMGDETERGRAMTLLRAAAAPERRAGRAMRPLIVLARMTERAAHENRPIGGAGDFARAVRAGWLGA
ncbi:squalene/phytoene synthase family protein [Croceicoccus sp. YJ47]|uniref:squalene/phytoene synthase family protein n=1 Tax=Croceicoccus sp. YJ47 TaxID=2798724 RepID=UPI0019214C9F|nr:squalene/phytoene synthase family protein [Croceicoccus sp. YJ47]QQN74217.1 squalene/phytoene synthase family protein [Croceicoccus sp. YJ47]